ncbi:MAG: TolC family protein [Prevotellaceae bacterium]|nr:TolC family protein [Candidatus Colivivens equi]MCQ2077681.1 TolC family protein [Bacteroidaceae bacterium]
MKKLCFFSALIFAPCLFSSVCAQDVMDITLDKAIEIALAENPTIRIADKDIQLKKIADTEAWQQLLPTVSVNGSIQHTLKAAVMKLNGQEFKMGRDGVNTAALSGSLNLPIFAPAVYQNMKLTKDDIKLAQEKSRSSRLDLINQVTKAYYSLLLANDALKVMTEAYDVSKQAYDNVSSKFNVGKVSEYDQITAEVQMRTMNSSKISAEGGVTLAELQLKVLMGITTDIKLNAQDKLRDYEKELTMANTVAQPNELENNSSLKQLELNKSMLERSLKLQRTNFMPTLSFQLTGQYQSLYNDDWNLPKYDWSPSASFTINLNIPIFTASNWTKLRSSKVKISQLEDTRINTERQLNMAASSYRKNMQTSLAEIESDKQAIAQADKAVNISSKRYEVGRGTVLDMNQSQLSLTQAQLTYDQAVYDFLTNQADLNLTLGKER